MRIPKKYGESQILKCPFCEKRALVKNKQGVPVCAGHARQEVHEMLCACKSVLELKKGKWGPYYHCHKCGNQNFKRVLEMGHSNKTEQAQTYSVPVQEKPKEISITTNDAQWFD